MNADPIIACEDVVEIASRRIVALISKDCDSIEDAIAVAKEIEEQATVARIALERWRALLIESKAPDATTPGADNDEG